MSGRMLCGRPDGKRRICGTTELGVQALYVNKAWWQGWVGVVPQTFEGAEEETGRRRKVDFVDFVTYK